jgi:type I restriction enzyme S subunit
LSEHLPLLAGAPDGIKKLRGLILELAVRGKLVPQDPSDEPASELLKRIAAEKTKLVAEGKIRGKATVSPLKNGDEPFLVPSNWAWAPFGEIMISRDGERIPVSRDERNGREKIYDYYGASGVIDKIDSYLFDKPLLLVGEDGANLINRSTPIAFIARGKYWVNNHAHVLDGITEDFLRFIELHINAIDLRPYVTGTAQPKMNQAKMNSIPIALPPLAEQHRIVAKVDELMALCDRMEAEQADAEAAHATLVQTLLGTLTQSRDAAELAANWQRLSQHFDTMFTTEASLDALKQTVLQLAVTGKLAPQDPNDEPASELLKRIAQERARLEAEGTCKKSKPMPPVGADEQPFEVPGGWEWVRWNDVAQKIGDIDHKMPETVKDGVPYVSPRDFYPDNRIDFEGAKRVSRDDFLRLSAKIRPEVGDIIYPRYGTIGENRLVVDDLEFLASYSCCVIKTLYGFVAPKFQFYFSISQCCRDQAKAAENKTTQANVGIKSIQEFALPLPPLAEQHRIVAKVDELMTLCDSLKADLAESRARQARLATTLIESALQAA